MALRDRGYEVAFIPDEDEATDNRSLNMVTLGPRKVLTVADNPNTKRFYDDLGIESVEAPASELGKAAGAIGCLTGVLRRELPELLVAGHQSARLQADEFQLVPQAIQFGRLGFGQH